MQKHASFSPLHPGEILREDILPALGMSKTKLAESLGISRQTLYDILGERVSITPQMALRLGKAFGNGARFWINLQNAFDLHKATEEVDLSAIPALAAAIS